MPECNLDDLLCQMQVLSHLKGMQGLLGEKFTDSFPEFEGLDTVVEEKIRNQEISLAEALERCGLPKEEYNVGGLDEQAEG